MSERDAARERFHAGGREEWIESPEYERQARAIEERVRARHAPRLAAAGAFRRLWLQLQMTAELQRELETLAPGEANWLTPPPEDGGGSRDLRARARER